MPGALPDMYIAYSTFYQRGPPSVICVILVVLEQQIYKEPLCKDDQQVKTDSALSQPQPQPQAPCLCWSGTRRSKRSYQTQVTGSF